jgi:hypothetical protein
MEMSYSPTNSSSELDVSMSAVSYESVSVSAASAVADLQPSLRNIKTAFENTNTEPSSMGYNPELLITPLD